MSQAPSDAKSTLSRCGKEYLIRLIAHFAGSTEDEAKRRFKGQNKDTLIGAIVSTYGPQSNSFASALDELRTCNFNSLRDLLEVEPGISIRSLDNIHDKKEWLLFVYQNSLQSKIRSYIARTKFAPTSSSKEYIVNGRTRNIRSESLKDDILTAIVKFNDKSTRQIYWKSEPTFSQIGKTQVFSLSILIEGKLQRARYFRFRRENNIPESKKFEVKQFTFQNVVKKDISVIIGDKHYLLNTNINLDRDSQILKTILNVLFMDGYSLEPVKYKGQSDLIRSSVKPNEKPAEHTKRIMDSFNILKAEKVTEINSSTISPEKKKVITEVIQNVSFGGIAAGATPEYSIEKFEYVFSDIDNAMKLPGSRDMAGSLLSLSKQLVLRFNYKSTRIDLEDGQLKLGKKLAPVEVEALKTLFGGDSDGE